MSYFSNIPRSAITLIYGLLLSFSLLCTTAASGQATTPDADSICLRPVYSAYQLTAGSTHNADTYLSPLKYSGWHLGFGYQRLQAMKFNPDNWVMQLKFDLMFDRTLSPSLNSSMLHAGIYGTWGMMRRWRLPFDGLSGGIGPAVALDAGCFYLNRNGNNPASAKCALTIDLSAYLSWSTRIGSVPLTLRYQGQLPTIGAFFSPAYGELYYEIYLGNKSGLAHCAWWGNYLSYNHQLTADIRLGSTSLRVGYEGRSLSTKVNDLTTHNFTHSAIIGVSGEWISLPRSGQLSKTTKIISATY